MPQQTARVVRTEQNWVLLEPIEQQGCNSCKLSSACGTSALGRLIGFRGLEIRLENTLGLQPQDRVVLSIPDQAFLVASLLIYLVPLVGLLLTAVLADFAGLADGWIALSGATGLVASIWLSGRFARHSYRKALQPSMSRQIYHGHL